MSSKKQKYYVVWHGHKPGIYSSWEQCLLQVKNFPNAVYKAFPSLADAKSAYQDGPQSTERKSKGSIKKSVETSLTNAGKEKIVNPSLSVDAACSGNPGAMEYRGVWTSDKTEIFHQGPFPNGTNNIGEFLAIVHALAWLKKQKDGTTPVYTDSRTALAWVKNKKAKTLLKPGKLNSELFELIRRAENWLRENEWSNPLLKWETERWGESPADFGRK